MYIDCFDTQLSSFRIRINLFVVGIILLILGVQSSSQMFNQTIQNYKHIKILSGALLSLGVILILIPFIYLNKKKDYIQINL